MPRVVFVLGAGASAQTGTPLMKDFLDRAMDLMQSDQVGSASDEFALVSDLLHRRLTALDSKSVVDVDNIESVFGLVEMARLIHRLPKTRPEEIDEVANAIKTVIGTTIEQTCRFPVRHGELKAHDYYQSLLQPLRERVIDGGAVDWAFLTFNYDVAPEVALHQLGLRADYGLDDDTYPEEERPSVQFFKLHGSINWAHCRKCRAIVPHGIHLIKSWRHVPVTTDDQTGVLPIQGVLGQQLHCGEPTEMRPAIVPPSWNKTQYHHGFAEIWRRAAEALSQAEHIIIVGYSMPASDSFFQDLLALGVYGITRVKRIWVINPDLAVHGRLRGLLGPRLQKRFHGTQADFAHTVNEIVQAVG